MEKEGGRTETAGKRKAKSPKAQAKGVKPPDDDLIADDLIAPDEVIDPVVKGIESGVKSGVKSGVQNAMKPFAAEAGEKAIKELMEGRKSPMKKTLEELAELTKMRAFEKYLNQMNGGADVQAPAMQNPTTAQQQSILDNFFNTVSKLNTMGFDTSEIVKKFDVGKLMMMSNPSMMPVLMAFQNERKNNGGNPAPAGGDMNMAIMSMMMEKMLSQMNQPGLGQMVPQAGGNQSPFGELIAGLMKSNQELQMRLFDQQQKIQESTQQLIFEQLKPYLSHRSFGEEIGELKEKLEGMRELGLIRDSAPSTPNELEKELRSRELAYDFKMKELEFDREMKLRQEELQLKRDESEGIKQMMEMFMNVMKTANLDKVFSTLTRGGANAVPMEASAVDDAGTPRPFKDDMAGRIDSILRRNLKGKRGNG